MKPVVSMFPLLLLSQSAFASSICKPLDTSRDEVECRTVDSIVESLARYEDEVEQPKGPKVRAADFAYLFNEMLVDHAVTDRDVLVIDVDYQMWRRRLQPVSWWSRLHTSSRLLTASLPSFNPYLRSNTQGLLNVAQSALTSSDDDDDMPMIDRGVNTDGQVLYGPPGKMAAWGCTGYGSVDTCKACCMATRTMGLAPIVAFAKWCHTAANGCTFAAWVCHAGCGVIEAGMLAGLIYSTSECNRNCEHVFWNDTSIDWAGQSSSALYWDDAQECRGILKGSGVTLNGGEHISIPGYTLVTQIGDSKRWNVECVVLSNEVTHDDFGWGGVAGNDVRVLGEAVPCPPGEREEMRVYGPVTHEIDHAGIRCMEIVDYRIVDVDPEQKYDQTPFVGVVRNDGDRYWMNLMRSEERLYLNGLPWYADNFKVWAWGKRSGNDLAVEDFGLLGYYAE